MKLTTIGSGSKGNCYLLEASTGEILMIECGVHIKQIKQALDFDYRKVVGCIVTHSHLDHSKSIHEVLGLGINVWASEATHEARGTTMNHRSSFLNNLDSTRLSEFRIKAFDVQHDVPTFGFLINHPECGNTLFLTDTFYCKYTFQDLNNIIIEANFSREIIDRKMQNGHAPKFLRDRILKSHLSLEYCKELLQANDLSQVNRVHLIHLSDSNSNEVQFQREIAELTGKNVTVASNGMCIEFNKEPF